MEISRQYTAFFAIKPASLTLEAPVVLHYPKAPTAIKLTGVCFIAF